MIWTERQPLEPASGGDVGGDWQSGKAYCRRWKAQLPDDHWAVIIDYWYPVSGPQSPGIERQTEYIICTDPEEPGATELRADIRYQHVCAEPSEAMARKLCAEVDVYDPMFDWDGQPR